MNIFDAVIQGTVQGLTEFLPVSSSGHLLISQHILGVKENNLFFNVMLHIGTLIAVLAVYRKEIIKLVKSFFIMLKKIFTRDFYIKKADKYEQMVITVIIGLIPLFLLFVPLGRSGINVKDVATELSDESNIILAGISLLITSVLLCKGIKRKRYTGFKNIEYENKENDNFLNGKKRVGFMDSVYIGVMQFVAAVFPGISRSGSTLSVGLMRGINKQTALDYSFILGIPAIVAAAVLELKEAFEENALAGVNIPALVIGVAVSAIVGFLSIKLFKWLLKTDKMKVFVVYTFVVGLAAIVVGIIEKIRGVNIFTGLSL